MNRNITSYSFLAFFSCINTSNCLDVNRITSKSGLLDLWDGYSGKERDAYIYIHAYMGHISNGNIEKNREHLITIFVEVLREYGHYLFTYLLGYS